MIVRIMGEGQFEVADADIDALNELDDALTTAVKQRDEAAFERGLAELLGRVREGGSSCSVDFLAPSDFVLPEAGSTIDEVEALLADDGLVPG
ncbi:MAG: hypothetical protein JWN41_1338 [Thermoleophilia bacterium]|nr:hypothetical protein [Thermoleophilia bacterium]